MKKSLLLFMLASSSMYAQNITTTPALSANDAEMLAFPGAQGWGRLATGGRYGTVYHVTNLNDSGTGSLRDAVSKPNRIVVFDVAGVINISSRMTFASNLYVAGQTAPGEGITVYGDGVSFSGANNLICRYLRVRMGHGGSNGKDCAGVANGTNMIFDHCSFAWGLDETFSINSDGKGALGDITLQNCIIGQGLMPHSAGGLMQADHISLYRNFYCDNSTRNNKVKGVNQYANNIVYNWSNAAYIMGGDSEGQSNCNIESNLFINGPSGGGAAFTGGNGNFHFYGDDNWQDNNADGTFSPFAVTDYSASDRKTKPYDYPKLDIISGKSLIEELLPTVGASLPYRDMPDCYMVDEVMTFGKRGELIANEGGLPYGVPSSWKVFKGNKRIDSDGDGMPDWWEEANGTNANKNDAMAIAANGYANIENYINSITDEQRDFFLRRPMSVALHNSSTSTITLQWADYTYKEEGFAVEMKGENGAWSEVMRTNADVTSCKIASLTPGTAYTFRLRAFAVQEGEAVFSDYSDELACKTRPVEMGIIDIDSYTPAYTWAPAVTEWNTATSAWKEGAAWVNDGTKGVLFDVDDNAEVKITEAVSPASVVVTGNADLILSGSGSIDGATTSVNKAGEGTLVLSTTNNYKGATVLHEGTIEFNTLKDGGVASSLGASQEFAQNWIMDGGTYRYTGASTSTNRSARLSRATTLDIAKKGVVVKMNGGIEGSGDLAIDGAGQVQIVGTGFFNYTGKTVLKGGELFLSTIDASKNELGKSAGLVLAGGKISTKGENEAYETYNFPIEAKEGTYSYYAPHRNCYMNNKLTGSGTIELVIPYVREYVKGDWSAFKGRIVANAVSKGNLFLANSNFNIPNAVVVLKNGARACNWATDGNATLGGLAGSSDSQLCGSSKQTNNFTCSWHIGSANTDEVFAGVINDFSCSGSGHVGKVSIEKTGSGYWRLTGANTYSGTTTVSNGKLIVNGVHTGKGAFTVANGATLAGQGTIPGNVTVKKGGNIMAGDSLIATRTFTLSGTTTLQSGASLTIPLRTYDAVVATNRIKATKLNINSGVALVIDMENVTTDIPNDKYITVFASGSSVTGTFAEIIPAEPSPTQKWDTTDLYTKGYLYIRDKDYGTAIEAVNDHSAEPKEAYTIDGRKTINLESGKIYIRNGKKIVKK